MHLDKKWLNVIDLWLCVWQGAFGKNALVAFGLATYTLLGLGVVCHLFNFHIWSIDFRIWLSAHGALFMNRWKDQVSTGSLCFIKISDNYWENFVTFMFLLGLSFLLCFKLSCEGICLVHKPPGLSELHSTSILMEGKKKRAPHNDCGCGEHY